MENEEMQGKKKDKKKIEIQDGVRRQTKRRRRRNTHRKINIDKK